MDAITLPKDLIHGERFAQLIVNAIEYHYDIHNPNDLYKKLLLVENVELEEAVDDYLNEVRAQEEEKNGKN